MSADAVGGQKARGAKAGEHPADQKKKGVSAACAAGGSDQRVHAGGMERKNPQKLDGECKSKAVQDADAHFLKKGKRAAAASSRAAKRKGGTAHTRADAPESGKKGQG